MKKNIFKLLTTLTMISIIIPNTIYAVDLTRDNTKNTVSDSSTNLMWQDDSTSIMEWSNAITYCEDLTLGGYADWRLPNRFELISLINYAKSSPAIKESVFQFSPSNPYWSATSRHSNNSDAWFVHFESGYSNKKDKSLNSSVRCVRDS